MEFGVTEQNSGWEFRMGFWSGILEFGAEILDEKVKMSEREREREMGKTSETSETSEKWKVGMGNGLQNLVYNIRSK